MTAAALWLRSFDAEPGRSVRLVVFPYAGGGASAFRTWPGQLPRGIAFHVVQLAGREARFREPPATRATDIIVPVTRAIASIDDGAPLVLFGHSMGAILAFEVARQLRRMGRGPSALVVSGRCAPQLRTRSPRLAHLDGMELVDRLAGLYGGIPPEVLAEVSLADLMARVLKGDLTVIEGYEYFPDELLACPIVACGGTEDPWVTPDELGGWREQTRGGFVAERYPGDHFYFRRADSERRLLDGVARVCAVSKTV